jgi:SAM-dependent methyltransferase
VSDPQRPEIEAHNAMQRRYYARADSSRILPEDTPYNRSQAARLVKFAGLKPGDRVLEVGCGMGRHAFLLAELGLVVEGLDLSPELIARLRQLDGGRYNIKTYVGDMLDPPADLHGGFDGVVGFFMLHHLTRGLTKYFTAMAKMLRPGGRLAFMEPNPNNLLFYVQFFLTPGIKWEAEKGILQMRRQILLDAMQAAGLRDPSFERFGFLPRFLYNRPWGPRLDALLEAGWPWKAALPFQMVAGIR